MTDKQIQKNRQAKRSKLEVGLRRERQRADNAEAEFAALRAAHDQLQHEAHALQAEVDRLEGPAERCKHAEAECVTTAKYLWAADDKATSLGKCNVIIAQQLEVLRSLNRDRWHKLTAVRCERDALAKAVDRQKTMRREEGNMDKRVLIQAVRACSSLNQGLRADLYELQTMPGVLEAAREARKLRKRLRRKSAEVQERTRSELALTAKLAEVRRHDEMVGMLIG